MYANAKASQPLTEVPRVMYSIIYLFSNQRKTRDDKQFLCFKLFGPFLSGEMEVELPSYILILSCNTGTTGEVMTRAAHANRIGRHTLSFEQRMTITHPAACRLIPIAVRLEVNG